MPRLSELLVFGVQVIPSMENRSNVPKRIETSQGEDPGTFGIKLHETAPNVTERMGTGSNVLKTDRDPTRSIQLCDLGHKHKLTLGAPGPSGIDMTIPHPCPKVKENLVDFYARAPVRAYIMVRATCQGSAPKNLCDLWHAQISIFCLAFAAPGAHNEFATDRGALPPTKGMMI